MLECVVNISEGRRLDVLNELGHACGASLRDRHSDPSHNRSVFTLIHERERLARDVRSLITAAMDLLDLRSHEGVHPRLGVVDVVPFVPLDRADEEIARTLRDETALFVADGFDVPVFLYGPLRDGTTRSLPEVRREAFHSLGPDAGPNTAHPRYGASALGARPILVAWNLWVRGTTLAHAKVVAAAIRRPEVRALALPVDGFVQISCNLIEPFKVGPSVVYDDVRALLRGGHIDHAELVGLAPEAVVRAEDSSRWSQLGLSLKHTIEARRP